jgi:hypothetical protein
METQTKNIEKPILTRIAEKLLKAQQEIDDMAVQMALGKAEARDTFEEVKTEFRKRLTELKKDFSTISQHESLVAKIEALEGMLNTGPAAEKSAFEAQKERIFAALAALESEMMKKIKSIPTGDDFVHEMEKFKLKMEILRLKFGLRKFELKEDFRRRMAEARKKIESITAQAKNKIKIGKSKYSDFNDEVQLAYNHLKKALEAL